MSDLVHLSDIRQRPRVYRAFERHRHTSVHWLVECFAEALGVFLYSRVGTLARTWVGSNQSCFEGRNLTDASSSGVGSQALYVLGNILKVEGASSILQIGLAYACGILLAITICSATSGGENPQGHFNPAVTITQLVFHKFPPLKGLRYITAQVLGGYIACLLVYLQYKTLILASEAALLEAGPGVSAATFYTPNGPGGIFALSLLPGSNLGRAWVNEFVCDFVLGVTIFASLDPTNTLIPPSFGPVLISLAYAVAIWSFSANGLAANAARDVGGRLVALTVWGLPAGGGSYAAIAALTNIPATLLGCVAYELMLSDSDRVIPAAHLEVLNAHKNHRRLRQQQEQEHGHHSAPTSLDEKGHVGEVERV
ncbi:aquaporin-like protein [Mycena metata]|uniref:Aquaporin-like protein n=1 Tax=Mycena metata TaxID=1033252 RepID=A0AAD7K2G2_9AGAR|nr:aquaporin-like protein [Mycena metata]